MFAVGATLPMSSVICVAPRPVMVGEPGNELAVKVGVISTPLTSKRDTEPVRPAGLVDVPRLAVSKRPSAVNKASDGNAFGDAPTEATNTASKLPLAL